MTESKGRITLWGIEVFLAAADEGSISIAARRLGTSPSTISQQISALELSFGVVLLDRDVRPIVMTPAGALFTAMPKLSSMQLSRRAPSFHRPHWRA